MTQEQRDKKNAYMREWKRRNPDKVNALSRRYRKSEDRQEYSRTYQKKWRAENPDAAKELKRRDNRRLLEEVVEGYGGACYCCSETNLLFLTIDHIFSDGCKERRDKTGENKGGFSGVHLYRWLRKNGFPKDRYRLSCFNCNAGRTRNNGVCPHQKEQTDGSPDRRAADVPRRA